MKGNSEPPGLGPSRTAPIGRSMADRIGSYFVFFGFFWTIVVVGFAVYDFHAEAVYVFDAATNQARAIFQRDLLFRRWAAMHGGVYVPATLESPPNPFLADIPERDIETPSPGVA